MYVQVYFGEKLFSPKKQQKDLKPIYRIAVATLNFTIKLFPRSQFLVGSDIGKRYS